MMYSTGNYTIIPQRDVHLVALMRSKGVSN